MHGSCLNRILCYICGDFAFLISFHSSFNVYIAVIRLEGNILIVEFYVQVR